jgi:hypothetical protein
MAAVARDRAIAEQRNAELASMALGVLDAALTGLDWALTASDIADTASMAAGPIGWKFKAGKTVAKGGVRGLKKLVRGYADDAVRSLRNAREKVMQLAQGVKREPRVSSRTLRSKWEKEYKTEWPVDPQTGKKMEVSHEIPLADGGSNDVSNIKPRPRDEHVQMHKDRGDYSRWSQQRGTKK